MSDSIYLLINKLAPWDEISEYRIFRIFADKDSAERYIKNHLTDASSSQLELVAVPIIK